MTGQNRSGIIHGHLCPCGKGATFRCQRCGRGLCNWHSAGSPAIPDGSTLRLVTVCLPVCGAPWWRSPLDSQSSAVESDDEREETKAHAKRLLERGGDPEAVAAELGLPERWVLAVARKAEKP